MALKDRIADKYPIIYNNKHFLWASLYGVCQIWFNYCERTTQPKYIMASKLDYYIPFEKWFVIPYLFWFVYMGIGFFYVGRASKKDFYRLCVYMFGGMCICYILYMLFPNGQNLRPVITDTDVLSRMIKHIYDTDTPTNVCPSIHVYNSIVIHLAICSCSELKERVKLKRFSFISMVLICVSTVFIKQHSVKDVMGGAILAVVMYGILYYLPKVLSSRDVLVANPNEASAK